MKELQYFNFWSGRDEELNGLLQEGWIPIRECPLPSGGNTGYKPTCLILLARDLQEDE